MLQFLFYKGEFLLKYLFFLLYCTLTLHAQNTDVLEQSYFLDAKHSVKVSDIYSKKVALIPMTKKNTTLGFKKETVWIYVKVRNKTKQQLSNIIQFTYPLHDFIDVYMYDDSKITERYRTGDLTKFQTRKIKTNDFIIPYKIAPKETKTIIFKINSQSALNIEMNFLSQNEYLSQLNNKNILYGIYYGAVLIMLLYNFILFFIIKEKVYLYYVAFHFTNLFTQLGLNGLAFEYFYPAYPLLNTVFIPVTFALSNYYIIKFALNFLEFQKLKTKFSRYFQLLSFLSIIALLFAFILPYATIIVLIVLLSMITVLSLFFTGLYILKRYKTDASKFFIIAWSFLLLGIFIEEAHNLGFLASSFITSYASQIGAFIELTLLSIALAYRYNTLFISLTKTKADLVILNKSLEEKVQERTQSLDEKNKHLHLEVTNKNILLRELYHRVKNNLQIISSLLSLQSKRIKDKEAKILFLESISRIKSIAMIHEKLYASDNLQVISMQNYTQDLISELQQSFSDKDIQFKIMCDTIHLNLEVGVPIGLIINELVTNALKYAFNDTQENKIISIKMIRNSDKSFTLTISDNGRGANISTIKDGFGFKLLEFLASYQLKGEIETTGESGITHKITFSEEFLI